MGNDLLISEFNISIGTFYSLKSCQGSGSFSNSVVSFGGAVSQWNDISGNNHNFTQDINDSKPITASFNQNGGNVIHFDGNDTLRRPYSNILNFNQTWLMVARIDSGGVDNAGDSLLSYGYISPGSWELRANNNSCLLYTSDAADE